MDINRLEKVLKENNQPGFRLSQIRKAIYQDGFSEWAEISTISKNLREILKEEIDILSFSAEEVLVSKDKRSIKALLKLKDGNLIETVLISPKPGDWSACISSQVGCPLGCGFCATGRGGFKRNLTSEEITDQVLFWRQYMANNFEFRISNFESNSNDKISNLKLDHSKFKIDSKLKIKNSKFSVVYMGMGEPFLNWDNVSQSMKDLINPELFGFGSRSISVSTAGIPEGIEKMAAEFGQVNLAISLHFPTDAGRSKFMPINKKFNLSELMNSLRTYVRTCNRKVFLEYIMLDGINDSMDDADNLIKYVKSIGKLQLFHVNLIRYNATSGELQPSPAGVVREFRDYLSRNGISVTTRKSLGEDIQGACGQLAGGSK